MNAQQGRCSPTLDSVAVLLPQSRASLKRGSSPTLCRRFMMDIPTGKYQNCGVALQRSRKNFCSFNSKINAIILNRRNRGLRNTRPLRQFILAQFLEFPENPDRFTNRNIYHLSGFSIIFHITYYDNHELSH